MIKRFTIFSVTIFNVAVQAQISLLDTSKLQDFKRQIQNSLIVGFGEVGHGYETINDTKSTLVEALQNEMNFDAILFESSFTESIVSFLVDSTVDSRVRNFLYPFWNTTSVKAVLKTFIDKEKHKPLIMGFDIQEDCRFSKFSKFLIDRQLVSDNKDKLLECDSILSYYIGQHFSRKGTIAVQEYVLLSHNYDIIETEIKAKEQESVQKKLLERCINNRKWLCRYLTLTTVNEKMYYRDSLMAANIAWLQKEIYRDSKLILWGANTHIAKCTSSKSPKWMGEWLSSIYGDKYFSIAFEKGDTNNNFFWEKTSYKYFSSPYKKFNLVIYLKKLTKIKPAEWITPCD